MSGIRPNITDAERRPSLPRMANSDDAVPMARWHTSAAFRHQQAVNPHLWQPFHSPGLPTPARPPLRRTAASDNIPLTPMSRRSSNPDTPAQRDMGGYFLQPPRRSMAEERRRSSAEQALIMLRRSSLARLVNNALNPPDETLIEPFSFVSTKTSVSSAIKLMLGIFGQGGYTLGAVLLVDSLYQIPGPPGLANGVGSARNGPDGHLPYSSPPVAVGAVIFGVGIVFGLISSALFLADGLRIVGNRRKAFAYVTMHLTGIALISASKFIVTLRKNHTNPQFFIALSLPAGIGRGLHSVTIPRSFSNSEIVHGDFARLTFEQRQIASEVLRVVAFIFFGLWAASWAVQDFNPLEREGYGILASLTLNVSAALPNTNLRRADIFRRSQQSLLSPALNSFRLGQPASSSHLPSPGRNAPIGPTDLPSPRLSDRDPA